MEAQAAIHDLIGSILAASDSLLAGADQRAPSELDLLVIDYLRRRGLPEAAASVAERARLTPATSMPPIDTLESLVARGRGPAQVLHACLKALSALNRIAAAPTAVPPSSSSLPLPRGWNAARPISQPLTRDTLGTLSDSQHAAGRSTEPVRKKRRLYLGNLKSDASEGQLASFLSAGGPFVSCQVAAPKAGYATVFGFVGYASEEQAAAALARFDKATFQGQELRVAYAEVQRR